MRIHYGGDNRDLEKNGVPGESLPSAKLRRQGKRVVVRSSGASHSGVQVRVPEENITDVSRNAPKPGECSVCQMARQGKPSLPPTITWQDHDVSPFPKKIETSIEPGFCTLRLPAAEAKYLGQLLVEAAREAESSPQDAPEWEKVPAPSTETKVEIQRLSNVEETKENDAPL